MEKQQQTLQPVDDFVMKGFQERLTEVFGCQAIITTANDKTKILERLNQGRRVEYPYIFATIQSQAPNQESYVANRLARRGLIAVVNDNQALRVRLLATNFEIQVEYFTNKFDGLTNSVRFFARRWLFARRCGYLKFNVNYGKLELPISMTLSDTVTIPELENKVEAETVYKIIVNLTIHGYVSEPELGVQGVLQTINVDAQVVGVADRPGHQFFPF